MFPALKVLVYATSVQVPPLDKCRLAKIHLPSKAVQHMYTLKSSVNPSHQQTPEMALLRLQSQEKRLKDHRKDDQFTFIFPSPEDDVIQDTWVRFCFPHYPSIC